MFAAEFLLLEIWILLFKMYKTNKNSHYIDYRLKHFKQ